MTVTRAVLSAILLVAFSSIAFSDCDECLGTCAADPVFIQVDLRQPMQLARAQKGKADLGLISTDVSGTGYTHDAPVENRRGRATSGLGTDASGTVSGAFVLKRPLGKPDLAQASRVLKAALEKLTRTEGDLTSAGNKHAWYTALDLANEMTQRFPDHQESVVGYQVLFEFQRCHEPSSKWESSLFAYADSLARVGKLTDAIRVVKETADLLSLRSHANRTLAIAMYSWILDKFPSNSACPQVMYEMARTREDPPHYSEAVDTYLKIAEVYPRSEFARVALARGAVVCIWTNRYADGIQAIDRLLERYPKDKDADKWLLTKARLLLSDRRPEEARRALDPILKGLPGASRGEARRLLASS